MCEPRERKKEKKNRQNEGMFKPTVRPTSQYDHPPAVPSSNGRKGADEAKIALRGLTQLGLELHYPTLRLLAPPSAFIEGKKRYTSASHLLPCDVGESYNLERPSYRLWYSSNPFSLKMYSTALLAHSWRLKHDFIQLSFETSPLVSNAHTRQKPKITSIAKKASPRMSATVLQKSQKLNDRPELGREERKRKKYGQSDSLTCVKDLNKSTP